MIAPATARGEAGVTHPDDKPLWEKIRKRGPPRYVVLHGVLTAGAPVFIAFMLAELLNSDTAPRAGRVFESAVVFPTPEAATGLAKWAWDESLYRGERRR